MSGDAWVATCARCGHAKREHYQSTEDEGCGWYVGPDDRAWPICRCHGFRLAVHNHGPEEGPGLACNERRVDGRLVGACMTTKEPGMSGDGCVSGQHCTSTEASCDAEWRTDVHPRACCECGGYMGVREFEA